MKVDRGTVLIILLSFVATGGTDFNPFSDDILHTINWVPAASLSEDPLLNDEDSLLVTTNNKEKYRCIFPKPQSKGSGSQDNDNYNGPSEEELLNPLFKQSSCSYRIESYWTYELCHGRYLRQYHEVKESGKKVNLQEYYLGYGKKEDAGQEPVPLEVEKEHKKRKVDSVELTYYQVNFTDGTKCDLTGDFRKARLYYVCQPEGKGEVYELKETSSCEYEVIVLTALLCSHPAYKTADQPVQGIRCEPLEGSPRRPKSLDLLELENTQGRYNRQQSYAVHQVVQKPKAEEEPVWDPTKGSHGTEVKSNTDQQLLKDFLKGEYCIQGGTGWWKHEFCYGKHLIQFHEEGGSKTVIALGVWSEGRHLQWLGENPSKRPKPVKERKYINHFYGAGDFCDLVGKPRQAEVRIKCKENTDSSHAVSLYLVEPETCAYVLVVESPILCELIDKADNNGIVKL